MIPAVQIARTIADVRSAVARARGENRSIALVPTMGALHSGHVSLIDSARRKQRDDGSENSDGTRPFVVVTIFVNPTQFAPHEDFSRYPRDEAGDLRACESAGTDLAFLPGVDEMYPADARTHIHVAQLTDTLCGPFRPGHFDGVATVVAKLFNIVRPDVAYFGRKDAQQLAVIRRVVRDLDFPLELVGCPTVREPDGLALSSRNRYLSPEQRQQALCLIRALRHAETRIRAGERDAERITCEMREMITQAGPSRVDYVSIVDANSLQPVKAIGAPVLIALAVHIGTTRLIDNITVDPRANGG